MLTDTLAGLMLEPKTVPQDVLEASRAALMDTLGVGIVGAGEDVTLTALRCALEGGGSGQASVWGTPHRVGAPDTAFVNGIASHALDYDDTMPSLRGHPSATMLPAGLAVAEMVGASGAELLTAYALGLELAGKLGRSFGSGHYLHGWHATATIGAFTATAVAGRIAGLTQAQLATAWGLAAAQAGGLVSNFGTMAKPFQAGHAARAGVQAVLLARAGFTANPAIFDGRQSFQSVYAANGEPLADLIAKWGTPWEVVSPGNNFKRWPCCYCNHRPLGALFDMLSKHGIRTEEVEKMRVGFPPGSDEALIHTNPQTGLAAKFSIEYSFAAAMLDRRLGLDAFTDEMVQRPAVRALMQKVERYRIPDDKVYSGTIGYNVIEIATSRGTFKERTERVPGSIESPMTPAEQAEKFLDCAGRVLGETQASSLHASLLRCEHLGRVDTLATLLRRS